MIIVYLNTNFSIFYSRVILSLKIHVSILNVNYFERITKSMMKKILNIAYHVSQNFHYNVLHGKQRERATADVKRSERNVGSSISSTRIQ